MVVEAGGTAVGRVGGRGEGEKEDGGGVTTEVTEGGVEGRRREVGGVARRREPLATNDGSRVRG